LEQDQLGKFSNFQGVGKKKDQQFCPALVLLKVSAQADFQECM
jgi:hypothetical protein